MTIMCKNICLFSFKKELSDQNISVNCKLQFVFLVFWGCFFHKYFIYINIPENSCYMSGNYNRNTTLHQTQCLLKQTKPFCIHHLHSYKTDLIILDTHFTLLIKQNKHFKTAYYGNVS